jgi:hypothetical protein
MAALTLAAFQRGLAELPLGAGNDTASPKGYGIL